MESQNCVDPVTNKQGFETLQSIKAVRRIGQHQEIRCIKWIPEVDREKHHETKPTRQSKDRT